MTRQSPVTCREVEVALLGGATRDLAARRPDAASARPGASGAASPERRAAIEAHLATCPACTDLQRALARDAAAIRQHVDSAEWLPVASRVFAALPRVAAQHEAPAAPESAPAAWTLPASRTAHQGPVHAPSAGQIRTGRDERPASGARATDPTQRPGRSSGRFGSAMRAACFVLLGLGLGVGFQPAWSQLFNARPTEQPGPSANDGTGADGGYAALPASGTLAAIDGQTGDSAYVPAPGDNPPLAVPGSGSANRISTAQNRDTWSAVSDSVVDLAPLLYPPVPPGSFESVTIGRVGPGDLVVRYSGSGMRMTVEAGVAATDDVAVGASTATGNQHFTSTVRGNPATVTITQDTSDAVDQSALAPGLNLTVTWTEPGATRDATGIVRATTTPYAVTAVGVPVDVVMTFAASLAPLDPGWDAVVAGLPAGETAILPTSLPDGFGQATQLAASPAEIDSATTANDRGDGWTIASSRTGAGGESDLIIFTVGGDATAPSAPGATPAETSSPVRVAGFDGTVTFSGTTGTADATWEIRWMVGDTPYLVTLAGAGITDAEVRALIDGLRPGPTTVPGSGSGSGSGSGQPTTTPGLLMDRAA